MKVMFMRTDLAHGTPYWDNHGFLSSVVAKPTVAFVFPGHGQTSVHWLTSKPLRHMAGKSCHGQT